MITEQQVTDVTIAFGQAGELRSWRSTLSSVELERLDRLLSDLIEMGSVATFSITPATDLCDWPKLIEHLRLRCGDLTVSACLGSPGRKPAMRPAFLAPIWPFDYALHGNPAATGQLLGLDLELIASPSTDEELGAILPGRTGRWLIYARPMF